MINQKESKKVRMGSWLLKLLKKQKTKINQQRIIKNNGKIKAMGDITPQTTIPEIDRCEIPILNLICHVNPGNE